MHNIYKFINENHEVTEIKSENLFCAIEEYTDRFWYFKVDSVKESLDDECEVVTVFVYKQKNYYERTTRDLICKLVNLGFDNDEVFKGVDSSLDYELGDDNRCDINYEILRDTLYEDICYGFLVEHEESIRYNKYRTSMLGILSDRCYE